MIIAKNAYQCPVYRLLRGFILRITVQWSHNKTLASTQKYLKIAADAGLHPVTLATAWSKQFDFVASTIIGATTAEQLDASLAAMNLTLSDEVLKACDKVHEEILYPMG